MTSIAVVSSCYGGYDRVRPPPPMEGVRFVMVSDAEIEGEALGWWWVNEARPHMHPRLAAKVAKVAPWHYAPGVDVVCWADASVEFKGEHLRTLVDKVDEPWAMWRHPWRGDIESEAEASKGMQKYLNQPVFEQVRHYAGAGMPLDYGLWATGFAVYHDGGSPVSEAMAIQWLAEQVRWSYQDQLSLPYICWRCQIRPGLIPEGWHLDNPWLTFLNHESEH